MSPESGGIYFLLNKLYYKSKLLTIKCIELAKSIIYFNSKRKGFNSGKIIIIWHP